MALRIASLSALLVAVVTASQPSAEKPLPAPMRELQWAQLNFLHTTDTHGWHGGHLQESQYSADWGDYVSLAHHMRRKADEKGVDLLLVDTGDRVEGNGLYDASTPKGQYTYDIYKQQDIDIICTGNHELYQADTAAREYAQTVPNFRDRYIASNLDYIEPKSGKQVPMAQRYRKFTTKNQNLTVVAFGFLFDFTGNANNTVVQPVEKTIMESWFQQAIQETADVFVVIGHVGIHMQEFKTIYAALRLRQPTTPIVFLGGHTHIRDATAYDARSFALESGRYFETVGWMSVDGLGKQAKDTDAGALSFSRRYLDNNLLGYYHHTGLNESTFPTAHGTKVTKMITKARKALDLDFRYGCAPQDYWMTRSPYPGNGSIFTWLETKVIPDIVVNDERGHIPRYAIINTGGIRFDIFQGAFTRDSTYIVSPFVSKFNYVPDVPYAVAQKVLALLNSGGNMLDMAAGVDARFMAIPEQWSQQRERIHDGEPPVSTGHNAADVSQQRVLGSASEDKPALIAGYTTKDDISADGDDAVHAPIAFYNVPNCIQSAIGFPTDGAQPKTVDLAFIDFIQPWVLVALRFSGGSYSDKDVKVYTNETFTDLMAGWIKKNWKAEC